MTNDTSMGAVKIWLREIIWNHWSTIIKSVAHESSIEIVQSEMHTQTNGVCLIDSAQAKSHWDGTNGMCLCVHQ